MSDLLGPIAFVGVVAVILLGIKMSRWTVKRQMEAYGRVQTLDGVLDELTQEAEGQGFYGRREDKKDELLN